MGMLTSRPAAGTSAFCAPSTSIVWVEFVFKQEFVMIIYSKLKRGASERRRCVSYIKGKLVPQRIHSLCVKVFVRFGVGVSRFNEQRVVISCLVG